MTDAFYYRDGDTWIPTELTRGPWDPKAQHGGPPAALLGTALDAAGGREDMMIARVCFELLRPIPIAPLGVTTRVVRNGRSVQLLSGSIQAGGEDVLRAQAVRIRTAPVPLVESVGGPLPGPDLGAPPDYFPTGISVGYHTAMDVSFIRGNFTEPGPATAWLRMRVPLVAGEPVAPLARVLAAADSGNGVSAALDYRRWTFINPDLTVHLHRYPAGEWVCLEAETTVSPHGVGQAVSRLHDTRGAFGHGLQSLLVAPRA